MTKEPHSDEVASQLIHPATFRAIRRRHKPSEFLWWVYIAALAIPALYGLARGARDVRLVVADVDAVVGFYGWLIAAALMFGLRTALRGGGIVLPGNSIYALLAPIPRAAIVLPAVRTAAAQAFGAGGVLGFLVGFAVVAPRPAPMPGWLALNALVGAVSGLAFVLATVVPAGEDRRRLAIKACAAATVAWPALDLMLGVVTFPGSVLALVLHAPQRAALTSAVGFVALGAGIAYALRVAAHTDLETAARRASRSSAFRLGILYGELGAAMLVRQDVAVEHPRPRPWLSLPGSDAPALGSFWRRTLRSYLRWPMGKVARVAGLLAMSGAVISLLPGGHPALLIAAVGLTWLTLLEFAGPLLQQINVERRSDCSARHEAVLRGLLVPMASIIALVLLPVAGLGLSKTGDWWILPLLVGAGVASVIATVLPSPVDLGGLMILSAEMYCIALMIRLTTPLIPLVIALDSLLSAQRQSAATVSAAVLPVLVGLALSLSWLDLHARRAQPRPSPA